VPAATGTGGFFVQPHSLQQTALAEHLPTAHTFGQPCFGQQMVVTAATGTSGFCGLQRLGQTATAAADSFGQEQPECFGKNERGAHLWPTAMFTGGVFGSQQSQHSQQPYSGQYSQQREVGLQQPAVPAAVGSSFFGLHYSEQPCSGQQPTVVTAEVVGSFPGAKIRALRLRAAAAA
jgi:hypothetical protein